MTKLIEHECVERQYGFGGMNAIVETDEGKRFLICDGFGGIDNLRGGAVRWEHGMAIHLQPDDTLDSLRTDMWNEHTSHLDAVIHGYDNSRPLFVGLDPTNLAKSVCLM